MLKEEYANKIVFGGIYRCKTKFPCDKYNDYLNEQKYGIWVPIYYEYESWDKKEYKGYGMIDTYQVEYDVSYTNDKDIDYTNLNKLEIIAKNLGEFKKPSKGHWAKRKTSDYYYSAFCELTDYNFNDFELVANLNDYTTTSNPEYYNREDTITSLRLYREHNYPYGINIVKKDAKPNYEYKISNKIYESKKYGYSVPSATYESNIKELLNLEKEVIEKNQYYDAKQLYIYIKENEFLEKQRKQYYKFMKKLEDSYVNKED